MSSSLPLSFSVAERDSVVLVFCACSRAASLPRGRRMASFSESELVDMAAGDFGEAEGESRRGDDGREDILTPIGNVGGD